MKCHIKNAITYQRVCKAGPSDRRAHLRISQDIPADSSCLICDFQINLFFSFADARIHLRERVFTMGNHTHRYPCSSHRWLCGALLMRIWTLCRTALQILVQRKNSLRCSGGCLLWSDYSGKAALSCQIWKNGRKVIGFSDDSKVYNKAK